jgi:endoglucanase
MNRRRFLGVPLAGLSWLPFRARAGDAPKRPRRGVSLAGAEFGAEGPQFSNENLGTYGKHYTYNGERTVRYFCDHGLRLLRIPFRWERVQPRLGEALDATELGRLREAVGHARKHGGEVILDVHNYCRYALRRRGVKVERIIDESPDVTRAHFADLWRQLAKAFKDEPAVYGYGLMNEPHDLGRSDWKAISQAAVDAIRAEADTKRILVGGDSWSSATRFAEVNGPRAWVKDPAGNVAYEAHCYFDADYSGQYKKTYDAELAADRKLPTRGADRVAPFVRWCRANRVPGFLGEFGIPAADARWREVLSGFLRELDRAGMDGCWWAAGEWWGDYPLSLQPRKDFTEPAPQLAVLTR